MAKYNSELAKNCRAMHFVSYTAPEWENRIIIILFTRGSRLISIVFALFTLFFCIFTMLMTTKWAVADTVPAIMHHFNGNGSIAYGTNIMKSMYQTIHSRSSKPTPSPTKPARKKKEKESVGYSRCFDVN